MVVQELDSMEWEDNFGIEPRDHNRNRCFRYQMGCFLTGRKDRWLLEPRGENSPHQLVGTSAVCLSLRTFLKEKVKSVLILTDNIAVVAL